MMRKLTTKRWLITHLAVLAAIVTLVNLGLWQLQRLEERRAYNAKIEAGLSQPAITLTGEDVDPAELYFRRVSAEGVFDNEASILLRNQAFNGIPGHHLVVPLRLKDSNKAVLVDRGWLPIEETDPEKRRAYDVSDQVRVEGIGYQTQERAHRFAPTDPTPQPGQERLDAWFRVDIDRIQEQLPYPLLPIFIRQSPNPNEAPNALPRPEGDPVLDEGPHLGYALQWFAFALILVITYGAFIWQEVKEKEAKAEKSGVREMNPPS